MFQVQLTNGLLLHIMQIQSHMHKVWGECTRQSGASKLVGSPGHSRTKNRDKETKRQQEQLTISQPTKMPTPVSPDRLEHHLKRIKYDTNKTKHLADGFRYWSEN